METENQLQPIVENSLTLMRKPDEILKDAKQSAMQLQTVIKNKRRPVIFNGEQYLEFEDWQTVGRFYGLTAKVVSTAFVEYGDAKGFEAKAVVLNVQTGMEISAAEAVCLNDEKNWSQKPLFQLKSMAQTRACAKALRNVLAWVAVLAGYKPTPAEEMSDVTPGETTAGERSEDVPDDQLGNWLMPVGKYKGMRLIQIVGQVTENGKKVGLEYLEWLSNQEPKTEKGKTQQEIIRRFVDLIHQSN